MVTRTIICVSLLSFLRFISGILPLLIGKHRKQTGKQGGGNDTQEMV